MTISNKSFYHDLTRTIELRNTHPINTPIDQDDLTFLSRFLLWKRPEKFFDPTTEEEIFITSGVVVRYNQTRCLRLVFNNGFVWNVKLGYLVKQYYRTEGKFSNSPRIEMPIEY